MKIIENGNNYILMEITPGLWRVYSYCTCVLVVAVDQTISDDVYMWRTWDGWSATTQRHINRALTTLKMSKLSKAKYLSLPFMEVE